jgi:hypothetical protein
LECLQTLPSYNAGTEQVLGHTANGCLEWFNVEDCASSSPTPTP